MCWEPLASLQAKYSGIYMVAWYVNHKYPIETRLFQVGYSLLEKGNPVSCIWNEMVVFPSSIALDNK